ncbi:MAG: MBL fold metallo-hydrolase [Halobacteriota archaeon]
MVTITILADNRVATSHPKGLRGEWGFSAAVDDVLFDTGQSDVALHNARLLGLPTQFETIVLSHAHYDHTGGLDHFLDPTARPTLYLHPEAWTDRYKLVGDGDDPDRVHTGIPFSRALVGTGADVVEHDDPVEVASGVHALGTIPRTHADTTVGYVDADGDLVDDPVVDDQALVVETGEGLALVLGCCHAGLRNSIEYAEEVCGDVVRYVVGGTHLIALDDDEIHDLAAWLDGTLEVFAGTHCTGTRAASIFAERLPDAFRSVGVGSTLELPS